MMWRLANHDVPFDEDASGPFLPWIVAVMVYLASLALAAALLLNQATGRWEQDLAGRLTIQVPPPSSVELARARPQDLQRLAETLTTRPEVAEATVLTSDELAALLEPWLGDAAVAADLPVPKLIAVTLRPEARLDLPALTRAVHGILPEAVVDDHRRWLGDLLALSRTVEIGAFVVLLLVAVCAVVTVAFLTRTGLAIHQQAIGLLHLIGAQDAYVARQFEAHAMWLGLRGGVIGLLCAAATILLIGGWLRATQNVVLPDLSLSLGSWAALLLLPLATALVTMMTARLTVLRSLARMP